eukprot:c23529_g1_i1 orf=105-1763(+)
MARHHRSNWKIHRRQIELHVVAIIALLFLCISIGSITILERKRNANNKNQKLASKIAFGSSTSYDYRPQPVWVHGVIPSNPDAWIWLGDMAYMDKPRVNCDAMPMHEQCNCSSDWLHVARDSCMTGNTEFAISRMEAQLSNPDYAQLLAYMCPGHRSKGLHPPIGPDRSVCPRQIFGTYDDHDYGWEMGNKRLPQKDELKNIFLNAVGEPNESPRRDWGHGIEWKYTLNDGITGREIDIYLLDERYYRDALPCHIRKSFCQNEVLSDMQHPKYTWCLDFLQGGEFGIGSCCKRDDEVFYGWCLQTLNRENPLWAGMCDPKSPSFGTHSIRIDHEGHLPNNVGLEHSDSNAEPSFCEVLGKKQRLWLESALLQSNAPLKLVVSSSVVLGNPVKKNCEGPNADIDGVECPCSGDDWECYKPAQLQFLELLSHVQGCVVLLTGDYHYSDIKVLRPGQQPYSKYYGDIQFSYPLFQVMASGLTTNTGLNFSCDALRKDPLGLRDHDECSFIRGPSFGMIEVLWVEPLIRLQIRDGMTGNIKLESNLSLSSCQAKHI